MFNCFIGLYVMKTKIFTIICNNDKYSYILDFITIRQYIKELLLVFLEISLNKVNVWVPRKMYFVFECTLISGKV